MAEEKLLQCLREFEALFPKCVESEAPLTLSEKLKLTRAYQADCSALYEKMNECKDVCIGTVETGCSDDDMYAFLIKNTPVVKKKEPNPQAKRQGGR